MVSEIGIVAGEILTYLEQAEGAVSLRELEDELDTSTELIHMSVGWLAREGYLNLVHEDHEFYVLNTNTTKIPSRINWREFEDMYF